MSFIITVCIDIHVPKSVHFRNFGRGACSRHVNSVDSAVRVNAEPHDGRRFPPPFPFLTIIFEGQAVRLRRPKQHPRSARISGGPLLFSCHSDAGTVAKY